MTDLAKQYAIQTDKDACATLDAGATATEALGSNDAAGLMTGLYNAGAAVFAGCGEMPYTLFSFRRTKNQRSYATNPALPKSPIY